MAAGTTTLCCTLLFVGVFVFVSGDKIIIRAKSGQNVTLPCRAPNNNNNVRVLKWSRADLELLYVLYYRDGHFLPDNQHPSFKNRVDLQDKQMMDGDASVILTTVRFNDTGTYECRVFTEETSSWELSSIIYLIVPPEQKIITAEFGQSVTLTCRAPNSNIIAVEWSRADLGSEYVLVYRDGHFLPDNQHPSFKNRVDLQDRQMKDGDASVILKDVTINDEGTYECRVFTREVVSLKLISIIYLTVVPPGPGGGTTEDGGSVVLIIGLAVSALLLVLESLVCCVFIYRKIKLSQDLKALY